MKKRAELTVYEIEGAETGGINSSHVLVIESHWNRHKTMLTLRFDGLPSITVSAAELAEACRSVPYG